MTSLVQTQLQQELALEVKMYAIWIIWCFVKLNFRLQNIKPPIIYVHGFTKCFTSDINTATIDC